MRPETPVRDGLASPLGLSELVSLAPSLTLEKVSSPTLPGLRFQKQRSSRHAEQFR